MRASKELQRTLVIAALLVAGLPAAFAQEARLITRPLTPNDIKIYSVVIPDTDPAQSADAATGLPNVGLGESVHLEAQVPTDTAVTGVVWSVDSAPTNSVATVTASMLPDEMPIYEPGERGQYDVAGRGRLVPDKLGAYVVTATVSLSAGDPLVLSVTVHAGTYIGVGTLGTTEPALAQCVTCHSVPGGDTVGEWEGTHHSDTMIRYLDDDSPDNHFRQTCIKCHSVGFRAELTADNGGFDDVQTDTGWTFPPTFQEGNWDAVPDLLKAKSNVQCESCHGPGSAHIGNPGKIALSYQGGVCASCHDSPTHHPHATEWLNSGHAASPTSPARPGRESCARCHSGTGFIDYVAGVPEEERRTDYTAISCSTCHDPHNGENVHQLRTLADVELRDGTKITVGGPGKVCMNCHQSRADALTYIPTSNSSRFGPHHGPQTDLLAGENQPDFGTYVPSTNHLLVIEESCVQCHMQPVASTAPGFLNVGEHTWKIAWDGGTPEDETDDVELTEACSQCHGEIEGLNIWTRKDFDRDGVAEGAQTEIDDLLAQLGAMLPSTNSTGLNLTERNALYAYKSVLEDRSRGIHNAAMISGMLRESIGSLEGIASEPLLGGSPAGGGWYLSSWFGYYTPALGDGWIFHENHGPLYVSKDVVGNIHFWDPAIGTWWTARPETYPIVYLHDGQNWMYFIPGDNGARWFYRFSDTQWIYYPGFDLTPGATGL